MNGRLSKELAAQAKMEKKLVDYPEIFKSFYVYLRAAGRTYSTINVYMNGIIRFAISICGENITNDFYKNITTDDIEKFLISIETTTKCGNIERTSSDARCAYWSHINTFWSFLVKRNYAKENIVEKTNRPKNTNEHSVVWLDKKEITRLMKAIDHNCDPVAKARDKALISVGLATALRCSAIVNLNIEDIDFNNKCMNVIEKENRSRVIQFSNQLAEILQEWIEVRNKEYDGVQTNALFVSQKKMRMSPDAANDALKKYGKEANINKKLTMHKLRSSAATNLAAAGVSVQAISKVLSHSSPSITMRYVEVLNEEKKQAVNVLDGLI